MFDIHRPFCDPDEGEIDWERVEELVDLFFDSPEAQQFDEEDTDWVWLMIEYSLSYPGVELPDMTTQDMGEVLFSLFPRKVSTDPEAAPEIVRQLKAFWRFLGREFHLANAPEILTLLDSGAESRLRKELDDPRNFGMAKSIFLMGQQAGYDMTTEEGANAFMEAFNARQLGGMPMPGMGVPPLEAPGYEDEPGEYYDDDEFEEERPPWNPFESSALTPKQRAEARKKKNKAQKHSKKKKRK
jgi:hypothetical protein